MKIALLTLGTRGDVQPFAVLGKKLRQRGHEVTLATAGNFASFIQTYDLPFVAVNADFQEILNSPEGKKMMSNPFSARKHLSRLIYPMMQDALSKFYKIAIENDRVLFHVKAMTDCFAEHLPGKLIRTNIVPAIEPTREFVNPIISFMGLPSFLNRFSYKLSEWGMKMMSKPINSFRKSVGIDTKYKKLRLPSIYGISPFFLNQPMDFPRDSYFTGFWFDESGPELDKEIIDFLDAGDPPLLITFGSMPFESKMNLYKSLDQLTKELDVRLIVIKGWGLSSAEEFTSNTNIKVVSSAPYEKLFPHVKAIIHHGGIGTIAACIKAGKPFATCPVLYPLGDQHFWGTVAFTKGIGLKPLPLKNIDTTILTQAAKELLRNGKLHTMSRLMMEKIKLENGTDNAADLVERFYD